MSLTPARKQKRARQREARDAHKAMRAKTPAQLAADLAEGLVTPTMPAGDKLAVVLVGGFADPRLHERAEQHPDELAVVDVPTQIVVVKRDSDEHFILQTWLRGLGVDAA